MAASGCYNIYYGFESGNQELLDLVDKGITLEDSRKAVQWAKEAGMEIRGSFILGLPTETPEMAEKTIQFACELNADWVLFFPYHVQRGTALEELAMKEGVLVEHDIDMHLPSYVPNGYSDSVELAAMIKRAFRTYYLRPRYMARALWRARNPAVLEELRGGLSVLAGVGSQRVRTGRSRSISLFCPPCGTSAAHRDLVVDTWTE